MFSHFSRTQDLWRTDTDGQTHSHGIYRAEHSLHSKNVQCDFEWGLSSFCTVSDGVVSVVGQCGTPKDMWDTWYYKAFFSLVTVISVCLILLGKVEALAAIKWCFTSHKKPDLTWVTVENLASWTEWKVVVVLYLKVVVVIYFYPTSCLLTAIFFCQTC